MDTFAALALATDPPTPSILDRKPEPKSAPLITVPMWKMIIGQSLYQLIVTLILYFGGTRILSYQSAREQSQLQTLVFNTFVWMQIFNQYNNRRLDNKLNIFEGIHRNWFFIGIQFLIVGGQVAIVEVGGAAFSTHRLNSAQWAYSIIFGAFSIPIAMTLRLTPDAWVQKCVPSWFARQATPVLVISDEERQPEYNPYEEIREQLTFMKMLRGGRINILRYRLQHPAETLLPRSRSGTNSLPSTPNNEQSDTASMQPPHTPDSRRSTQRKPPRSRSNSAFSPAAAMMASGIVAGSVAGWSPIGRRSEEGLGSATNGRSQLLDQEGIEVHPATSSHDAAGLDRPKESHAPPSQVPELTPKPAKSGNSSLAPPQTAY